MYCFAESRLRALGYEDDELIGPDDDSIHYWINWLINRNLCLNKVSATLGCISTHVNVNAP